MQNGSEVKFIKTVESNNENVYTKPETEARMGIDSKLDGQNLQPLEPPKQDYIHVRARRGQATDSHSLAERVSMILVRKIINLFFFLITISSL